MIKFNQIVRASVLSLTLVSGLGLASHAFAYDQVDMDDATADYSQKLGEANTLEARVSLDQEKISLDDEAIYNDNAQYAVNYNNYAANMDACFTWQNTSNNAYVPVCLDDAYNAYLDANSRADAQLMFDESTEGMDNDQLSADQSDLDAALQLLQSAVDWLNTVTNDQNGQHGQP